MSMLKYKSFVVYGVAGLLISCFAAVSAQPLSHQPLTHQPKSNAVTSAAVDKQVETNIIARLKKARPEITFSDVEVSPITNLYKIKVNGQIAFVSKDGGHLIAGEMYQVHGNSFVNLQEQDRREAEIAFAPQRAKMLSQIKKDDMVVYTPEKETKGFVYVFTDIDCPYCRRLHSTVGEFLDKGIEVRYLAFPRAGVNSRSAQKLETTWCADNRTDIMDQYKQGKDVSIATCANNPVADQYMLGQEVGVTGTPAIILESGQIIPGAVSAEYVQKAMGI